MNARMTHNRLFRLLMPVVLTLSMIPMAIAPPQASAVVVVGSMWVDAVNGSDVNPGTEAAPYKTLTRALASASATDTIIVEPGTYDTANGEVFPLDDYGASLIAAGGPELTIIQGDGTHGLLVGRNFAEGDVISGLTFAGGGVDAGAGICVYVESDTGANSPCIEGNVFEGNDSSYFGGGLAVFATGAGLAEPLIQNNTFRDNTADQGGAAAVVGNVSATFLGNTFEANSAYIAGALQILNTDSTVIVDGNEFVGNGASALAGAVHMSSTSEQTQSVSDNTFTGNHAAYDGGALFLADGTIEVDGNQANNNSAVGFGGFTRVGVADVTAVNNAVVDSTGGEGGAAWHVTDGGSLSEQNDTVTEADSSPSVTTGDPGATIEIDSCIYWNPDVPVDVEYADSIEYSCVSDELVADASRKNVIGDGLIEEDPLFAEPGTAEVALLPGSPCVESANEADAPDADVYETARPQDGNNDGTALPDIGCYEVPDPDGSFIVSDAPPVETEPVPEVTEPEPEPEPEPVVVEPVTLVTNNKSVFATTKPSGARSKK